jgi:hypothetical protein
MAIKNVLLKVKTASSAGAFAHPAPLICFVGAAVLAPIALVSMGGDQPNNLPWYFWVLALSLVLVVIGAGFMKFARKRPDSEDISISPDRR